MSDKKLRVCMVVACANDVSGSSMRDDARMSPVLHPAIHNLLDGLKDRQDIEVEVIYGRQSPGAGEDRWEGSVHYVPVKYRPWPIPGMGGPCVARTMALPSPDRSFDYAVCNVTLQMAMYPEKLLSEMARVASRQIVCFPNFANLRNRLELLLMGRMPRAMLFGYPWWETGHIHQLSVREFEEYLPRVGLRIRRRAFFGRLATAASFAPNLFATLAAFALEPAVVSSK